MTGRKRYNLCWLLLYNILNKVRNKLYIYEFIPIEECIDCQKKKKRWWVGRESLSCYRPPTTTTNKRLLIKICCKLSLVCTERNSFQIRHPVQIASCVFDLPRTSSSISL